MTLGGEVEQGRVNDAARVGQSTDLVMAPLFLLCFRLFQLLLLCLFSLWIFTEMSLFFLHLLWVFSLFKAPFQNNHHLRVSL